MENLYEVLGINENASPDEIKKAYRKLSLQYHPDRNGNSSESTIKIQSINAAYEMPLSEGIRFERRLFHSCFGTDDQKEGMAAFIEKRAPQFKNS